MKKIILSVFITSFIFTSCSLQNGFLKRKYTKGVFMEKTAAHTAVKQHLSTADKNTNNLVSLSFEKESMHHQSNNNSPTTLQTPSDHQYTAQSIIKNQRKNINNSSKNKDIIIASSSKNSMQEGFFNNHTTYHQSVSKPSLNVTAAASDDDKIIQIILAIFPILCLIAIYLHDGKTVTTNFWIDLILHFLLFFPAIIFALLVVLDVINLK